MYVSRWASADSAAEFAAIYAHSLKKRYTKAEEAGGAPRGETAPGDDMLKGRHSWTTEEGAVVIEAQGDTVLVSESLDAATTAALEKEIFAKAAVAK
jgi:hypothetical protein